MDGYLDEASLRPTEIAAEFVTLSSLMREIRARQHRLFYGEDLYAAEVAPSLNLTQLLFEPGHIPTDLRLALQVQINGASTWAPAAGGTTHDQAAARRAAGDDTYCVVVNSRHADHVGAAAALPDHLDALERRVLQSRTMDETAFMAACAAHFRNLHFLPGLDAQIRRFSRGFSAVRADLVEALGLLNDELLSLLNEGFVGAELTRRFEALGRFGFTPESPNTHRNEAAMRHRNVAVGAQIFKCEWHVKLLPDADRIHVHFPAAGIGNGKQVLVGIFTEHLPT